MAGSNDETIFRKDIDLSLLAEQDFVWERICIDLTKYYGKEVTLYLDKGFIKDAQNEPEIIYDLTPLEFMFWRVPSIRPKRILDKLN